MDIGLTDPSITLTIKAPNQQIDDQTIKCKLDWSVAKLKGYIHETYPNKPKTEDQRLIYSGQLLIDSVILKDVLRPYDEDGQLNRTVHLVCASSSCCIPPKEKIKSEQNNGVTQKYPKVDEINYGASTSGINGSSEANQEYKSSFSKTKQETKTQQNQTRPENNNQLTPEEIATQQIMWVNKMYASQMAAYWQSVASSLETPEQSTTQNVNNESPPQDLPNINNNNNQPANQNDAVGNNAVNRNVQEAGPNQDWLDRLYVTSRVIIFMSILYFYSSPGRFIVVAGFALLLYLYQNGILRHIHEHNRRRAQPEPQAQQQAEENRNVPQENTNDTAVAPSERLVTTLWTVISTFFTSLIPQHPDII